MVARPRDSGRPGGRRLSVMPRNMAREAVLLKAASSGPIFKLDQYPLLRTGSASRKENLRSLGVGAAVGEPRPADCHKSPIFRRQKSCLSLDFNRSTRRRSDRCLRVASEPNRRWRMTLQNPIFCESIANLLAKNQKPML
jgi:hypothetical protein